MAKIPHQQRLVAQAYEDATQPRTDPQYPVPVVAQILSVAPKTVREYFKLPPHHPRRLPYVDTTGTARGYRVPTSQLTAWQQRNCPDAAPLELPVSRPARRRMAA